MTPYNLGCTLDCDPGYIQSKRSVTNCTSGVWTNPIDNMTCVRSVGLVTGSSGSSIASKHVEVYSPSGLCNKALPALPEGMSHGTVDYVDGHVILCGLDNCYQLTHKNHWDSYSDSSNGKSYKSSIVTGGTLVLLGGKRDEWQTPTKSTYSLTPNTSNLWSRGFDLAAATAMACSVKISPDSFLILGGLDYDNNAKASVLEYNIKTGSHKILPGLASPKYDHDCVLVQNETFRGVLVTGGSCCQVGYECTVSSASELLDLSLGTWQEVGHLNFARAGHKMVVLEDKILAVGGHNGDFGMYNVEQFDLATQTWRYTETEDLHYPRYDHDITTVPAEMFDCDVPE